MQALINLLNNAYKNTKQGSISVNVDMIRGLDGKKHHRVEVADTGKGIREEDVASLFTPFTRLHKNYA